MRCKRENAWLGICHRLAIALAMLVASAGRARAEATTDPSTTAPMPVVQLQPPTAVADGVTLNWTTTSRQVANFRIERSVGSAYQFVIIGWVPASAPAWTYTDHVSAEKKYYYRVVAEDDAKNTLGLSDEALLDATTVNIIGVMHGNGKLSLPELLDTHFWQQSANVVLLGALAFIPKLIVAMFLMGVFWAIYRIMRGIVIGSMTKARVDSSIRDMLASILKWSILGFGLVIAGNQVGLEIAALLTGVSIIGLAMGFAAQETLANFIAGVVIFWDKPFKVGDWIIVEGMFGKVQRVSFRSTRMLNNNGETIVMPNTYMLDNRVFNHSTHPVIRLEIPIGIAYKESIDTARAALLATTTGDSRVCVEPAPTVVVTQCADSSVNLLLRVWIRDESTERTVFADYLEKAKKALDAANIQIPFPHMQLFLEHTSAIAALSGGKPQ